MLLGLRVLERMRVEYADSGGNEEDVNPFVARANRGGKTKAHGKLKTEHDDDADHGEGGFMRDGEEDEHPALAPSPPVRAHDDGGGFLVDDGDYGEGDGGGGGGFLLDDDNEQNDEAPPKDHAPITPISLQSIHKPGLDAGTHQESGSENAERAPGRSKPKSKANKPPGSTAAATQKRRRSVPKADLARKTPDDESSLSDLTSASDQSSGEDMTDQHGPARRSRDKKQASPEVVIAPQRPGRAPRRSKGTSKSTPVKSQYFDDAAVEGPDPGSDSSSDVEVVRPRQTTARTRTRADR